MPVDRFTAGRLGLATRPARLPRGRPTDDLSPTRTDLRTQNEVDANRVAGETGRVNLRIQCLCVDTSDPAQLASFWQSALGWRRTYEDAEEVVLEPSAGSSEDGVVPDLLFLRVHEQKAGKNRLHLDLRPEDQAAEVTRLEQLGARRVSVGQGADVSWVVLADPDGNEFCVLRPLTPEELADT